MQMVESLRLHVGDMEIAVPAAGSLLAAIRDAGLPIMSVCGGKQACGTCRVEIDPQWLIRLPPQGPREVRLLGILASTGPRSRLACQIQLDPGLDGLTLKLTKHTANS